ncbi:hypothetical protein [Burkholderia sp. S-53]|uniref:hypothetical protein n=1 Tax=Burkholderia sp. S-53 TaxID=2906514 RepID=UPI0021D0F85D|nr:hypothetical protein [Burkholderia sp. S-53]UXU91927.1 hypothetical protein LXM88_27610 [Burkholderia sp. S-53]
MTRSAAYPAHSVMSIFSGSVLIVSARRQIRYCQRHSFTGNTPYPRNTDSATGYTTRITEPQSRIRLFFSSEQLNPNRFPATCHSRKSRFSIDQINIGPQSADRIQCQPTAVAGCPGHHPLKTCRRVSFDHRSIQFPRFKRYCATSKQNQTALSP